MRLRLIASDLALAMKALMASAARLTRIESIIEVNDGTAIMTRMPNTAMATTSSMSVKPC